MTGHFIEYAGQETEVEAFLVRDYAREGSSGWSTFRFELAQDAAEFIATSRTRQLVRLGSRINGQENWGNHAAIAPVYEALKP